MHQQTTARGDVSPTRSHSHSARVASARWDWSVEGLNPLASEDGRSGGAGPSIVRRVDELIRARLREPIDAGELARLAGVSARTLFRTYRRYRGRTPIQTLRRVRLERVRRELLSPGPGTTVTRAAIGWGFTHLGRFAETYRRAFGEVPSATLRRAQMASDEASA